MAESGRELVARIYRAALAGADPGLSVRQALDPAQLLTLLFEPDRQAPTFAMW